MKRSVASLAAALALLLVVTLPAAVQAQFNCVTNNGTITITGYTGPGGDLTIPSEITGLPVTSIGVAAFRWCGLTSVTIPNGVTSIGASAFEFCTSLRTVTIPVGVTSIGERAFYRCTSLTNITVDALNATYNSAEGVLFDKSLTTLIECPGGKTGSYTIPSSVTTIAVSAFEACTCLTSVTIPNSVTTIGDYAFNACNSLTNVTVGNRLTTIGAVAFANCSNLTSVTIPNSVTNIGESAFGSSGLTSVMIPDRVTCLGAYAFHQCTRLTNVTIGNSMTYVQTEAFSLCTWLTGVYFRGDAPTSVMPVFYGANKANVYYLPGTTGWGPTYGGRPTAPWHLPNPVILDFGPSFGVKTNAFGFIISWATNASVAAEACPSLTHSVWSPIRTNTLTDGWSYFSDPDWTNHTSRFYRLRSP